MMLYADDITIMLLRLLFHSLNREAMSSMRTIESPKADFEVRTQALAKLDLS